MYSPVSGTVVETNAALSDTPALVRSPPNESRKRGPAQGRALISARRTPLPPRPRARARTTAAPLTAAPLRPYLTRCLSIYATR